MIRSSLLKPFSPPTTPFFSPSLSTAADPYESSFAPLPPSHSYLSLLARDADSNRLRNSASGVNGRDMIKGEKEKSGTDTGMV